MATITSLHTYHERIRRERVIAELIKESDGNWWALLYLLALLREQIRSTRKT